MLQNLLDSGPLEKFKQYSCSPFFTSTFDGVAILGPVRFLKKSDLEEEGPRNFPRLILWLPEPESAIFIYVYQCMCLEDFFRPNLGCSFDTISVKYDRMVGTIENWS